MVAQPPAVAGAIPAGAARAVADAGGALGAAFAAAAAAGGGDGSVATARELLAGLRARGDGCRARRNNHADGGQRSDDRHPAHVRTGKAG